MRKHILIIILLITAKLFSSNVITLPYITTDIVYSARHGKVYAIIDAMDTEYGNRLIEININTGEVERSLFIGSQPWRIRLTTDENYIWVSFGAIPFIKRIYLNTLTIDKNINLGLSQQYAPQYRKNSQILCYNFTVFPNENNKLAMGLKTSFVFDYEGVVLYKDNEIQPKRFNENESSHHIPGCFEPVLSNSYLIGHKQATNSSIFTTIKVMDDGLELENEFEGLIEAGAKLRRNWIKVHKDTVYVAEGIVIDASDISSPQTIGKCENDFINDLYGFTFSEIHDAYIYPNFNNNSIYLTFYDKNSFMAYDSVFLMEYDYSQIMMISQLEVIDRDRFAIVIGKDYGTFDLRIIDTKGTSVEEEELNELLTIYPNPSSGRVYINGLPKHKTIYIYNITGQLIKSLESHKATTEIPTDNLKPGAYLLKISDTENMSSYLTRKIIVQ